MTRKPAARRAKSSSGRSQRADDSSATDRADSNAEPPLDISTVEGMIPVERLKNGWTLPEYDPDNPEHERVARQLADLLWRVQKRRAAERRAQAEADTRAAEPKFVRVRRKRGRRLNTKNKDGSRR